MPKSVICDMDGVIYRGNELIPGAVEFVEQLQRGGHKFLFLTNNSKHTPRDLKRRLEMLGINVSEDHFYT
ncbi:MAG: TIGR01457 family HAD-type hydrolase, partial [Bacillota bacterium]